jgi:hypothetical protein
VEAARKDAVAKMQDMRMEVRKWQAATRKAERERDHTITSATHHQDRHDSAASSTATGGADADIELASGISSALSGAVVDGCDQVETQSSRQYGSRSANAAGIGGSNRSPARQQANRSELRGGQSSSPHVVRTEGDQRVDSDGASPTRVVRRMPGLDVPLAVIDMENTGSTSISTSAEPELELEPEPEQPVPRRSMTGMPPLFGSSGKSSGNRVAAMRSRMKQAMQKEEDPSRLTELVLESMEFGDALETERTALQVRSSPIRHVRDFWSPCRKSYQRGRSCVAWRRTDSNEF